MADLTENKACLSDRVSGLQEKHSRERKIGRNTGKWERNVRRTGGEDKKYLAKAMSVRECGCMRFGVSVRKRERVP